MNFLDFLFYGLYNNKSGSLVGHAEIDSYTIDTCWTLDCGYETAVWKGDGEIVIVGYYKTREEATEGHKDWVSVCKLHPTMVWSVQLNEYVTL